MRALLFAFCLILPIAGPVVAQTTQPALDRAQMIRMMAQIPELAPIRQDLMELGFRGENLELAVHQTEMFYTDPVIAGFIADQVIALYRDPPKVREAQGLFWPLVDRGLGHLPSRELQYFYKVEHVMMSALPERQCGLIVRKRLSAERYSDAMSRAAARLNTPALREYYRIQLKAARIGAGRDAVILSSAAVDRTEARIRTAMDARIAASGDVRGLKAAAQDLSRASNRRACQIGEMFFQSVMAMEGQALREALIYMATP